MKREHEEESEEEVFERRRKIQRKEEEVKEEIEDLFENRSEESAEEEKSEEEAEEWQVMRGNASAGVLLEIFGDGSDYLGVLESLARPLVHAPSEKKAEAEAKEAEVNERDAVEKTCGYLREIFGSISEDKIEAAVKGIFEGKSRTEVLEGVYHCFEGAKECTLVMRGEELREEQRVKEKIRKRFPNTEDRRVKYVEESHGRLKTPEDYIRLFRYLGYLRTCTEEEKEVAVRITERLTGREMQREAGKADGDAVSGGDDNRGGNGGNGVSGTDGGDNRAGTDGSDGTDNRAVVSDNSTTPTNDKTTPLIHGVSAICELDGEVSSKRRTKEGRITQGHAVNPWLFNLAVHIGIEEAGRIRLSGETSQEISLRRVSRADILLLKALRKRGVSYVISVDKKKLAMRIIEKLQEGGDRDAGGYAGGDVNICDRDGTGDGDERVRVPPGEPFSGEQIEVVVTQMVEQTEKDILRRIERELVLEAEELVKISLLEKLMSLFTLRSEKHRVKGVWLTSAGVFRYTVLDQKGAVVSSGAVQGKDEVFGSRTEDESRKEEIWGMTGAGYKIKPYMKRKDVTYVREEILKMVKKSAPGADLSLSLVQFMRDPAGVFEQIVSMECAFPPLVPLENELPKEEISKIWKYAVDCEKSRRALLRSPEYQRLKKELYEYLKSGGSMHNVEAEKSSGIDAVRRSVKEAASPHTGWRDQKDDPVIQSPILRTAYKSCLNKLRGVSSRAEVEVTPREEFCVLNKISEEELLSIEKKWVLTSGVEISVPGRVMEGTIAYLKTEAGIQLENGATGVMLKTQTKPAMQIGQRIEVEVVEIDWESGRVVVKEHKKKGDPELQALKNWRVKNVTAKGAVRLLSEKPIGSFVMRPSSTHKDSLILTVRMTEYPDECVCAHIRIKEHRQGYEIEGRLKKDLEEIVSTYVPSYTKHLKYVVAHKRFTMEPLTKIRKTVENGKSRGIFYLFSVSRAVPGCISLVYSSAGEIKEILPCVVEKGLFFEGNLFSRPEDLLWYLKKNGAIDIGDK